jgi:hypothetical protein
MTSRAANSNAAPWFPRLLGALGTLLALLNLGDLLYTSADRAEQVLFGYMFTGAAAQGVTIIHIVFFAVAAWGCFARRAIMAWVVIGYFVYVVLALWIWTSLYRMSAADYSLSTMLTNALASVVLLAFCRVTYGRRAAFNQ